MYFDPDKVTSSLKRPFMRGAIAFPGLSRGVLLMLLLGPVGGVWATREAPVRHLDPKDFGADVDAATPDDDAFAHLLEEVGITPAVVRIDQAYVFREQVTFPANLTLQFEPSGRLRSRDMLVRIDGRIEASPTQAIFDLAEPLTGDPDNEHVFPEWFGADGIDDTPALRLAIRSFDRAREVRLSSREYVLGSGNLAVRDHLRILGQGKDATMIRIPDEAEWVTRNAAKLFAILGHGTRTGVMIADLTLDLNFQGQVKNSDKGPFPKSTLGGILVRGSDIHVEGVRVLNPGVGSEGGEAFGVLIGGDRRVTEVEVLAGSWLRTRNPHWRWQIGDRVQFLGDQGTPPEGYFYVTEHRPGAIRVARSRDGRPARIPDMESLRMAYHPEEYLPSRILDCEGTIDVDPRYQCFESDRVPGTPEISFFVLLGLIDEAAPRDVSRMRMIGVVSGCRIHDIIQQEHPLRNRVYGIGVSMGRDALLFGNRMEAVETGILFSKSWWPAAEIRIFDNVAVQSYALLEVIQPGASVLGFLRDLHVYDNRFIAPAPGSRAAVRLISNADDKAWNARDILIRNNRFTLSAETAAFDLFSIGAPAIADVRIHNNQIEAMSADQPVQIFRDRSWVPLEMISEFQGNQRPNGKTIEMADAIEQVR